MPVVAAQSFPGKPIRIVVPFTADGSSDIVAKLHQEIVRILNQSDMRQRLEKEGAQIVGSTPQQFGVFVRAEIAKWTRVVKASGATAD